ncbi:MAG TPA: DUF5985 family protein [Myxococcota bacterium]|nr:DUF5985 family protein [Myxococcota bacterium]
MIEGFLLGVIVTASLTASLYFFKFWTQTRDLLFLGFAAAFLIEGINRLTRLFADDPSEGDPQTYIVRGLAFLTLLAAIAYKNRR